MPEGKSSSPPPPVPEETWKEIVDEFEESQNLTAKLVLHTFKSYYCTDEGKKSTEQKKLKFLLKATLTGRRRPVIKDTWWYAIFLKKKTVTFYNWIGR